MPYSSPTEVAEGALSGGRHFFFAADLRDTLSAVGILIAGVITQNGTTRMQNSRRGCHVAQEYRPYRDLGGGTAGYGVSDEGGSKAGYRRPARQGTVGGNRW